MAKPTGTHQRSRCLNCGFEATERSAWDVVETPQFDELTQCPECGSTRVTILS